MKSRSVSDVTPASRVRRCHDSLGRATCSCTGHTEWILPPVTQCNDVTASRFYAAFTTATFYDRHNIHATAAPCSIASIYSEILRRHCPSDRTSGSGSRDESRIAERRVKSCMATEQFIRSGLSTCCVILAGGLAAAWKHFGLINFVTLRTPLKLSTRFFFGGRGGGRAYGGCQSGFKVPNSFSELWFETRARPRWLGKLANHIVQSNSACYPDKLTRRWVENQQGFLLLVEWLLDYGCRIFDCAAWWNAHWSHWRSNYTTAHYNNALNYLLIYVSSINHAGFCRYNYIAYQGPTWLDN